MSNQYVVNTKTWMVHRVDCSNRPTTWAVPWKPADFRPRSACGQCLQCRIPHV